MRTECVIRDCIDFNIDVLADSRLLQLCFLKIGEHPDILFHHREQCLAGLNTRAAFRRLFSNNAVAWRDDRCVGKLQLRIR